MRLDLAQDPLNVALPVGHPLGHLKRISVQDLRDQPMIAPARQDGTQLYDVLHALFDFYGFQPRIVYESSQMPCALNMVAAGQGIAIHPVFLQKLPISGVIYRPLVTPRGLPKASMTFNLIAPRLHGNAAVKHFLDTALSMPKRDA